MNDAQLPNSPHVQIDIAANLAQVRQRMAAAAHRAGRDPAAITLVAVSKTKPLALIQAAQAAGQIDFGENRLEELWEKVNALQEEPGPPIRWHMIGSIQSRKTSQAVGPFALIHSVDRVKIAHRIAQTAQEAGRVMPILLEVNVSGEASKQGFSPSDLSAAVAEIAALEGVEIQGLMTMAPLVDDPQETRPFFRELRQLLERLREQFPNLAWRHLSMGMTNDFEVAVEEGATIIRVGSAIFGSR